MNTTDVGTAMTRTAQTRGRGFTLIELMVVIAIVLLAAGLMVPSLADFFRNRALDGTRAEITAAFSSARLQAVANNRPFAVVFFQEGVRIYDVRRQTWHEDDDFDPRTALAAGDDLSFQVVFAGLHSDPIRATVDTPCLPRYDDWWKAIEATGVLDASIADENVAPKFPIEGLIAIHFERDGTLRTVVPGEVYVHPPPGGDGAFGTVSLRQKGSDVAAAQYKKDPPENADIVVIQRGNNFGCFVDLQMTGSVKSRIASAERVLERIRMEAER